MNQNHYYGDISRVMFMLAAVIMLLTLPIVKDSINVPVIISLTAVVVIGLLAGLMNPVQRWVTVVNLAVGVLALVIFEYQTVKAFEDQKALFAAINQLLALFFLLSVYYNMKTLRGSFIN